MVEPETPLFSLIAGELCLDFTNTVSGRDKADPHAPVTNDKLASYADLLAWSELAGVLTPSLAARLRSEAEQRPAAALAALERAIALREAMYRVFAARAAAAATDVEDLAVLNDALAAAMARARLIPVGEGFVWDWPDGEDALDRMLWPVARSAAELLTSSRVERVHECEGDTCTWLFVDTSKNHSRRWCDMKDCGNRAKARRHYHRTRNAS
ncbi:MAG: ABATE domain-containing protein [Anaerolineae bacterium]